MLLLAPAITPTAAQELPTHVRVSGASVTPLDFSAYRSQIESLAAYSRDIVINVSAHNFTNAQALLIGYNVVADQFKTFNGTSSDQVRVLDAIKASRVDLSQLVVKSQRFDVLNNRQATLVASSPYSGESTNNTLEMQQLVTDLGANKVDLDTRNRDIADVVAPYGFHLEYNDTTGTFTRYMSDVSSRLSNVTNLVFRNTTISTQIDRSVVQYGDTIRFAGIVRTDQGGVSDAPVNIFIDNQTARSVRTNATGYYNYTFVVEDVGAGTHVAGVSFVPQGIPYKGSSSGTVRFSVKETPVTNTLAVNGGSLALFNKIDFYGTITTDKGPVTNAPIVLYVNNNAQIITHTDGNGTYTLAYSMGLPEFLGSLVNSERQRFYTLLEPGDRPLGSAQSETLTTPVFGTDMAALAGSVVGGYLIIAVAVLVVATPPLYVRRRRKQSARQVQPLTAPAVEPIVIPEAPAAEPVSAPTLAHRGAPVPALKVDLSDVIKNASGLFDDGNGDEAIMSLYDAMISLLVGLRSVTLTLSMTNWEKFAVIESAAPEARKPACALTYADELARYSGKAVSRDVLETAIRALASIGVLSDSERAAEL